MRRYGFVVCAHGLGHLVRILRVAGELLRAGEGRRAVTWAAPGALERLEGSELLRWASVDGLELSPVDAELLLPEALGAGDPSGRAGTGPPDRELEECDVVVSDNLVEVLRRHPDAVLSASFLWHEVLGHGAAPEGADLDRVADYTRRCRALLDEHVPPMICNRYFAMPGVRRSTRPVEVGMLSPVWDGDAPRARDRVLVHAGSAPRTFRERAAAELLPSVAAACGEEVRVATDARLREAAGAGTGSLPEPFGYDSAFRTVRACVGRPGMGLVGDCAGARVPLIAVYEQGHPEMAHNARVLEELGIGVDAGADFAAAAGALEEVLAGNGPPREAAFAALDRKGAEQTVRFLEAYDPT